MLATLLGNEKRATVQTLGHPAAGIIGWMGGQQHTAGVFVNEDTALNFSAVWAATRIISETVAGLPLFLYERQTDGGKRKADENPLYRIVHDEPNDEMSKYTFFETLTAHVVNWGNAFSEIERAVARPAALHPITPDRARIYRDKSSGVVYDVRNDDGTSTRLLAADVLHVPGLGFDGLTGYSVIQKAAASIGVSIAAERYGGRFFSGDAKVAGVLSHPQKLSDQARENLRKEWRHMHGGPDKSGNIAILQEGMTYNSIGIAPEEAQFLGTRLFGIQEIARWYRLSPTLLGDLSHGTFANVEQESLNFVIFSITSWLRRWEAALNRSLLSSKEKGKLFMEFLVDGLLRGDTASRFNSYAIARQWGWLSINDIRRLENMNPIDEGGDVYLSPLNMSDAADAGEIEQPNEDQDRMLAKLRDEVEGRTKAALQDHHAALMADWRTNWESTAKEIRAASQSLDFSRYDSEIKSLRNDREEILKELKETENRIAVAFVRSLEELRSEYQSQRQRERETVERAAVEAVEDVLRRMVGKEIESAKQFSGNPKRYLDQLDKFYESHAMRLRTALVKPLAVYLAVVQDTRDKDSVAASIADVHVSQSKETLLACAECQANELPKRVEAAVGDWMDRRTKLTLGA